ncbi:MAG: alkylation repair protein [Devosia sp.]|uniref:DNA alkylation repair protein n=1 Tax=Devosia sp. TaxID=1871048 RepID=UPI00261D31E9|nr:DNA alkylation repair protein [Devosia sp.]MDB5540274.1 alkylation repair protein [Devosia sp.]
MELTADAILDRLHALRSDEELEKYRRYFKFGEGEYAHGDTFIGVRMGHVFALAKECVLTPPAEIEKLMEADIHEARAAAMSIMAKQYAARKTTPERRQELYDLYLRRHDRINNWDLVDLAAWHVIGPHLVDRPRDALYRLAKSDSMWERRTSILATFAFIRHGQLDDTFAISELLMDDPEDLIHKAVGWMLRSADGQRPALNGFLDRHAARMPRIMLRNALEHYSAEERAHYLAMGKAG